MCSISFPQLQPSYSFSLILFGRFKWIVECWDIHCCIHWSVCMIIYRNKIYTYLYPSCAYINPEEVGHAWRCVNHVMHGRFNPVQHAESADHNFCKSKATRTDVIMQKCVFDNNSIMWPTSSDINQRYLQCVQYTCFASIIAWSVCTWWCTHIWYSY